METEIRGNQVKGFPMLSALLLLCIVGGCLLAEPLFGGNPAFMHLEHPNMPPSAEFPFGTDPLGRDLFSMLWHGGRVSLWIGVGATALSTAIALIYGSLSGLAPRWVDCLLMRGAELLLSMPSILVTLFIQAVLGRRDPGALIFVIGVTTWMQMARVARTQVRGLRHSGFVQAAKNMGGGSFYIMSRHLVPNLLPAMVFMIVTNLGSAIGTEATLSFLGIGLPMETVSWGSMLSMADRAFMTGNWRLILLPGLFLVTTLVSITNLGDYLRKEKNPKCSNFI